MVFTLSKSNATLVATILPPMKMSSSIRIVLIWLVIINIVAVVALNRVTLKPDTAYSWIQPQDFFQQSSWNVIDLHSRWDSVWYLDIAQHGYSYAGPHALSNIAFFPLYPALISLVSFVVGGYSVLAGWLISVTALLFAVHYLERLVREFHPEVDTRLVTLLWLLFPTAFFLNAVYTESLFICLSVMSFYFVRRHQLWLAGLFGCLAALTRVTGVLLFIPLVMEIWAHRSSFSWRRASTMLLVPLGTMSYFLYHLVRFGDVLAWFHVESAWGRTFHLNADHFATLTRPAAINLSLDIGFVFLAVVMAVMVWKKLRPSYGMYMVLTLIVALSTGTLMSIGRYALVLFPIFILLAKYRHHLVVQAWMLLSGLLLSLNILLFVNSYWAG